MGAWIEVIRVLENMGVHHGEERFYSKSEMLGLLTAIYAVAMEELYDDEKEGIQTPLPEGPYGVGEAR